VPSIAGGSEQGLEVTLFASETLLKAGVEEGRFAAGLSLDPVARNVTAYLPAEAPPSCANRSASSRGGSRCPCPAKRCP